MPERDEMTQTYSPDRSRLTKYMKPGKSYSSKEVISLIDVGGLRHRVAMFQEAKVLGYIQDVKHPMSGMESITFWRINQ